MNYWSVEITAIDIEEGTGYLVARASGIECPDLWVLVWRHVFPPEEVLPLTVRVEGDDNIVLYTGVRPLDELTEIWRRAQDDIQLVDNEYLFYYRLVALATKKATYLKDLIWEVNRQLEELKDRVNSLEATMENMDDYLHDVAGDTKELTESVLNLQAWTKTIAEDQDVLKKLQYLEEQIKRLANRVDLLEEGQI